MAIASLLLAPQTSDEKIHNWVDHLLQDAIAQSVSDIHIEPYEKYCRIRYRSDGLLVETTHIPLEMAYRVITLLKVMAKLNIAEKRLPQDGRFRVHDIDIRINVCPTLFGEKLVLRLLNSDKVLLELDKMGLNPLQKTILIDTILKPQGLILVTGPTGSGKTVTLYSILNYLNSTEKNISTVEDPVEIQLPGINQVPLHSKIGFDFPCVLRALLRQDPDVMMIGEIRDKETADIAIQAAHTGHLILSTVHTNSAHETIARLISLGITPYHITSATSLIISQRLLRKLCVKCKQKSSLNGQTHFQPIGCTACTQGYKGRCAIYEFLPMTQTLASEILKQGLKWQLSNLSHIKTNLQDAAKELVSNGITSFDEVKRVLGILEPHGSNNNLSI